MPTTTTSGFGKSVTSAAFARPGRNPSRHGSHGCLVRIPALRVKPDIVTMAKGIVNGMPVGAIWARDDVAEAFGPGDHGSTYAGQPLALSAAQATWPNLSDLMRPLWPGLRV